MILFPPAKINLGLRVTAKRNDGFHNIESLLYPIPLQDVLEFREAAVCKLKLYGKPIPGKLSENLLCKTWELLKKHYDIPPVEIHLLKSIPAGSGLGGGSSDRSEEHTSELQSHSFISYAVFCLKKKKSTHLNSHSFTSSAAFRLEPPHSLHSTLLPPPL